MTNALALHIIYIDTAGDKTAVFTIPARRKMIFYQRCKKDFRSNHPQTVLINLKSIERKGKKKWQKKNRVSWPAKMS